MQRVKNLPPEEIAQRIVRFDQELCTETFLGELKGLLPTPEQVFKPSRDEITFLNICFRLGN